MLVAGVHLDRDRAAVPGAERRLVGFGETLLEIGLHAQPVDDDLDCVLGRLGELRHRVDLVHLAVDADADEALGAQLDEELQLLALPVDDDRSEDHQLRVVGERERRVDHLRDRHRRELLFGVVGTIRVADPREEQPQVVVDLGDRSHGRARIVRGRLLLDRNRRRQSFDQVDVRLLHELQELARVRRQRLDVAALPLGVERVERERTLAGAGQSGDDDQPVTRQLEVDVLEIVRARAAYADVFHAGCRSWSWPSDRRRRGVEVALGWVAVGFVTLSCPHLPCAARPESSDLGRPAHAGIAGQPDTIPAFRTCIEAAANPRTDPPCNTLVPRAISRAAPTICGSVSGGSPLWRARRRGRRGSTITQILPME